MSLLGRVVNNWWGRAEKSETKTPPPTDPRRDFDEKIRAYLGGGISGRIQFLPWIGDQTDETPAMRRAYRQMLKDPVVKAALYTKVLGVASLDVQVQPGVPRSPRHAETAEFIQHNIERCPGGAVGIVQAITLGKLIDGFGVAEKVYEVDEEHPKFKGYIVASAIKDKDTEHLRLEGDEFGNVTTVVATNNFGQDRTEFHIHDFIYTKNLPVFGKPTGVSDFRPVYPDFWMFDTVRKLRAIHAEKWTSPFLLGTYVDPADRPKLEKALEQAKSSTWMAVPETVRISAMDIAGGSESTYRSFLDDCQKRILIGITGAYLQILEGQIADGRGSASISKSITELFQWLLVIDAQEALNRQWVPDLIRWNYGDIELPRVTLGGVSEYEQQGLINLFAGAQQLGHKLSKAKTAEMLSLPLADDNEPEDLLLGPGQQDPNAMGGGMGFPGMDMGFGGDPSMMGGAVPPGGDPNAAQSGADQAQPFAEEDGLAAKIRRALNPHESFAWKQGQRGGQYWLPDGKPDQPEHRLYGQDAQDAARRAQSGATGQSSPISPPGSTFRDIADQFTGNPVIDRKLAQAAVPEIKREMHKFAAHAARHTITPEEVTQVKETLDRAGQSPQFARDRIVQDVAAIGQAKSPGVIRRILSGFTNFLKGVGKRFFGGIMNDLRVTVKSGLGAAKTFGKAGLVWGGSLLLAGGLILSPAFLPAAVPWGLKLLAGAGALVAAPLAIREGTYRAGDIIRKRYDKQTANVQVGYKARVPFLGKGKPVVTPMGEWEDFEDDWDWGFGLV